MFYIQRTKWAPGKVIITHTGPFETKDDATTKLKKMRYSKHIDTMIIEKENNDSQN